MRCPSCHDPRLTPVELAGGLPAGTCGACKGHWVSSRHYWAWLESAGPDRADRPLKELAPAETDTSHAKLCPDCGRILIRYWVGHGIDFYLDHCNNCNGVWLDEHEWDVLRGRDLDHEMHRIFTTPWQRRAREQESAARYDALIEARLGEDDHAELKRVHAWLADHAERPLILAYLAEHEGPS